MSWRTCSTTGIGDGGDGAHGRRHEAHDVQVRNFRSVEDSGWIAVDDVTALIGINESGKTNLLLPLRKLKPAKDGEINLVADAPPKRYSEITNAAGVSYEGPGRLAGATVRRVCPSCG